MKRADILTALAVPSFDWESVLIHAKSRSKTLRPLCRAVLQFLAYNYELAVEWTGTRLCISALILLADEGDPLVAEVLSKLDERAVRLLFGPDVSAQAVGHLLLALARHDPAHLRPLYHCEASEEFRQGIFLALTWTAVVDKHANAIMAFEELANPIMMFHGGFSANGKRLDQASPHYWTARCVAQCASIIDPGRWTLTLMSMAQKGIFDFTPKDDFEWNLEKAFAEAFKSGVAIQADDWTYMRNFSWFSLMCRYPAPSEILNMDSTLDLNALHAVCILSRPQRNYEHQFASVLEIKRELLIPVIKASLRWVYSQYCSSYFTPFLDSLISLCILYPETSFHESLIGIARRHATFTYGPDDSRIRLGQALMRTIGNNAKSVYELFEMAQSTNEWASVAGAAIAYGSVGPEPIRRIVWRNLIKRKNKEWIRYHIDFIREGGSIAQYAPDEKAKAKFLSFAGDDWELDFQELRSQMMWGSPQPMSEASRQSVTKAYDTSTNMRGQRFMSKTVQERRRAEDNSLH